AMTINNSIRVNPRLRKALAERCAKENIFIFIGIWVTMPRLIAVLTEEVNDYFQLFLGPLSRSPKSTNHELTLINTNCLGSGRRGDLVELVLSEAEGAPLAETIFSF